MILHTDNLRRQPLTGSGIRTAPKTRSLGAFLFHSPIPTVDIEIEVSSNTLPVVEIWSFRYTSLVSFWAFATSPFYTDAGG